MSTASLLLATCFGACSKRKLLQIMVLAVLLHPPPSNVNFTLVPLTGKCKIWQIVVVLCIVTGNSSPYNWKLHCRNNGMYTRDNFGVWG
jgi:hypothetical protein